LRPRDIVDLVLLGAIWGGAFPLLRVSVPQFGAVPLVLVRIGVAATVLLVLAGGIRKLREQAGALFALGLLNTAIPFVLFSFAAYSLTAGLLGLLNATTPMFGALVAYFWVGERLSALRVFGILLGFVGVGAIVWDAIGTRGEGAALGVLAALVGSAMYGVAASFAKRRMATSDARTIAAGSVLGATIAISPIAAASWPEVTPGAVAWGAAVALGLVCTALAYLIYFRLVRNVGPSKAVTVTFLIPVFGILWGAIFLHEPVTLELIGSCVLVLIGTALATGLADRMRSA
jgi:drug/metabolite transporter (DMT)-like permease